MKIDEGEIRTFAFQTIRSVICFFPFPIIIPHLLPERAYYAAKQLGLRLRSTEIHQRYRAISRTHVHHVQKQFGRWTR